MTPYDCYRTYLAIKNHFTKENFDFFKYNGKGNASETAFNKRKDKYFFEKTSRKFNNKEIVDYFVSNFIVSDNLWIGEIIHSGQKNYLEWVNRKENLSLFFKDETEKLFLEFNLEEIFDCSKGHPPILKKFLGGEISFETLVIYDKVFSYGKNFDKKLLDPVWETVSLKIKKYSPFLNIDIFKYKKILKECIL